MSLINSLYNKEEESKFKITRGMLILIGIIAIVIIIIVIILISLFNKNKTKYTQEDFNSLEKRMIDEAPIYISQKNIELTSQEYKIDLKDMLEENGGSINSSKVKASKICDGYVIATKTTSDNYKAYIKCGNLYVTQGYITNDITTTTKKTSTNKDAIKPDIVLNGDNIIKIKVGDEYKELGAKALDNKDGDITSRIKTEGSVNVRKAGEYIISYSVTDSSGNFNSITRKIVVEEKIIETTANSTKPHIKTTAKTTTRATSNKTTTKKKVPTSPPTITLKGDKIIKLNIGQSYKEPGYYATDGFGSDITSRVKISGNVNTNVSGTYYINYNVTDYYGLSSTVTRIINVKSDYIKLTGISISPNAITLKKGNTKTFVVYFNPTNASDKSLSWSSSNPSVAVVNSSGKVTAKNKGTTIITVKGADNTSAKALVTVE